ncbi:MAG: histidinol-phosphate transaminase [Gammaproteobacteria bacterium]|nr:histidinol-phosphate transaminase [Gammaproteobacteria bacterium]
MTFERKNIQKMQGYAPGEQPSTANIIKLNTNENPYPPSPQVLTALKSIDVTALRRYPSPMADSFREAASRLHNISAEQIIPTNGGDELLRLVLTTYVEQLDTIAVCKPSYSLYPVLAEIQGCQLKEIPLLDDWSMPEDFLTQLNKSAAKLLILVNPNAPTGALLRVDYLAEIAENFSGLLLIDEAYVDFIDPELNYDSISLINSHDNILILRTLSKAYSLAGLRFGYGIGAKSLIEPMMFKTRDSYNTDYIAQSLATAALDSFEYAQENCKRIRQSREQMRTDLRELGLNSPASQSNFILCQVPESIGAEKLYQQLKQRNILVRYFDQDRLRDKLRISIGTDAENAALVAAVKELGNL